MEYPATADMINSAMSVVLKNGSDYYFHFLLCFCIRNFCYCIDKDYDVFCVCKD